MLVKEKIIFLTHGMYGTARFCWIFSFDRRRGGEYYCAPMFSERLPVHIDPLRMVEARRVLHGEIPLAEMVRLLDSVTAAEGNVSITLEFGVDVEGIRYMRGSLLARVVLTCQRCLEPMDFPIDSRFALALVRSIDEAERLPSYYEPLLLDGELLFLRDVIEDELLLMLPIVPRHAEADCPLVLNALQAGDLQTDSQHTDKPNPFSVLANLKIDGKH